MGIELTGILYDAVDRLFEALQKIRKYKTETSETETPETKLHIKDDGTLYVERDCGDVTFGSDPDQLLHVFDGDDHTIKIDSNDGTHRKILISSDGEITIDAVYKWGGKSNDTTKRCAR